MSDAGTSALADWPAFARDIAGRPIAVFLDYDGTLTPIVERPEAAVLSAGMRATLEGLAAVCPTCIVSGRGLEDVRSLVAVESLVYAGSHGFDIAGPGIRREVDPSLASRLAPVAQALRRELDPVPGAAVEEKRFAIAIHYRLAADADVPRIEHAVDEAIRRDAELRKTLGKKVFEIRPALAWDKGRAVLWLLDALGLGAEDVCPIYVGDDVTDEDAFRAIATIGLGVLVAETPIPTAARFTLSDPDEVEVFLGRLTAEARQAASRPR